MNSENITVNETSNTPGSTDTTSNTPVTTAPKAEPKSAKAARGHKRLRTSTVPKPGLDKNIREMTKQALQFKAMERRRLLTIPKEILEANPDKHFAFISMKKLQENGMWHPEGYELFKATDVPDNLVNKFFKDSDGFVRRREMVLAYIPKEEYELRQMEREVLKGQRDVSDVILKDPNLKGFQPTADCTIEEVPFPENNKEVTNG